MCNTSTYSAIPYYCRPSYRKRCDRGEGCHVDQQLGIRNKEEYDDWGFRYRTSKKECQEGLFGIVGIRQNTMEIVV